MNAPDRQLTTRQNAENVLVAISGEVEAGLPKTVPVERFKAAFLTAAVNNKSIFDCDMKSIQIALLRCAADGLVPDGRQAALVPFKGTCTYMPMVQGIIKRAKELGDISRIDAQCVYENDEFDRLLGDDDRIFHRPPPLSSDRGKIIGSYAIFYGPPGEVVHREVMSRGDLDKVRSVGRSSGGVWKEWEGEMCRKSAIRRGSKYVPMSDALRQIITRDDEMVDLTARRDEPSPAIARLQAARGSQCAAALPPIAEHVEREIAAMGRDGAGGAPTDGGGGPAFPPGFADTLRAYSTTLFKGDTARAIRTHDAAFWQDKNDLTDAEIDVVRRVFAQHESRTAGALDPRHCIAAVDQIIREVA